MKHSIFALATLMLLTSVSFASDSCRLQVPKDIEESALRILDKKFTLVSIGEASDYQLILNTSKKTDIVGTTEYHATANIYLATANVLNTSEIVASKNAHTKLGVRINDSKCIEIATKRAVKKLPACKDGGLHF